MSITVRVKIMVGTDANLKVLRFAENMSVFEACKTISQKVTGDSTGTDHGLYQPPNEEDVKGGKWLRSDRTLGHYEIKNNDYLLYRKKTEPLRIKLVDGTLKTILADTSISVTGLVAIIGKKIGLKNCEEYSLQFENGSNESKSFFFNTSTAWLHQDGSILEQLDNTSQIVVLKKKFFISEGTIDRDDPVQLHLVYSQAKDDLVNGRYPVSRDEAVQLAALQCQVEQGSFSPQLSANIKTETCLSPTWRKEKGADKLISNEWKKFAGLTEINAKYRYVQFCRSLKTFGSTFFQVKERVKGQKKVINKFVCFNRDSIMKLSSESTIEKTWPLTQLRRWTASGGTITFDFGSHEQDYIVFITDEGEAISSLIGGYIDIIVKRQQDRSVVIENPEEEAEVAQVTEIGKLQTVGYNANNVVIGAPEFGLKNVVDVDSASRALNKMHSYVVSNVNSPNIQKSSLSEEKRREQILLNISNVEALSAKLTSLIAEGDKNQINIAVKSLAAALEQLIGSSNTGDLKYPVFDSVKGVIEAAQGLLAVASEANGKAPDSVKFEKATITMLAATAKTASITKGRIYDEINAKLSTEYGKNIANQIGDLLQIARSTNPTDAIKAAQLTAASDSVSRAAEMLVLLAKSIGGSLSDPTCKKLVDENSSALHKSLLFLKATTKASGASDSTNREMDDNLNRLRDLLGQFNSVSEFPELTGGDQASIFLTATESMLQHAVLLMTSFGKPEQFQTALTGIITQQESLSSVITAISATLEPADSNRFKGYATSVETVISKLSMFVAEAISNPGDEKVQNQQKRLAVELAQGIQSLVLEAGQTVTATTFYTAVKDAAAKTTSLILTCNSVKGKLADKAIEQAILMSARPSQEEINKLFSMLKNINTPNGVENALTACNALAPAALKLVAEIKVAAPRIADPNIKKDLQIAADNCSKGIQDLISAQKSINIRYAAVGISEATDIMQATEAELDYLQLSIQQGTIAKALVKPAPRDVALKGIQDAIKQVADALKLFTISIRDSPTEIGNMSKVLSSADTQLLQAGKLLISSVEDQSLQRGIISAVKGIHDQLGGFIQAAKVTVSNQKDDLTRLLSDAGKDVAGALAKLVNISKGISSKAVEEHQEKAAAEIEDVAEREMTKAASVINNAVQRILKAQEETKAKRQLVAPVDLPQQEVAEAILEACHAIGSSTSALMQSATTLQQEFNKLSNNSENKAFYKRDPAWTEGLISASREVAATVQHLVGVSDATVRGEAVEEKLMVAAGDFLCEIDMLDALSATTARLVSASTVKNVDASRIQKLVEASKQVKASAKGLVEAAKASSNLREQKEQEDTNNNSGGSEYTLSNSKIVEMEQQMEILRLEKELEKKRMALLSQRKLEYQNSTPSKGTQTPVPVKRPLPLKSTEPPSKPAQRPSVPAKKPTLPPKPQSSSEPLPPPPAVELPPAVIEEPSLTGQFVWRKSSAFDESGNPID